MRLPPAKRNLSRVGRFWNLPHWHLPEPKPHCGSLESRVEWQHFLHPFRIPQYGKHLNLLKKKSQVVQWLRSDCFLNLFVCGCVCGGALVFWINASFVSGIFYLWTIRNWKQDWFWYLMVWSRAVAIVRVVWLYSSITSHDIFTNHYWTTIWQPYVVCFFIVFRYMPFKKMEERSKLAPI